MLTITATQITSMYGYPGNSCTCIKGNRSVRKIRAALLKLPPKAVAAGESVCTMVNWTMLYMNANTPDKTNQAIVVLFKLHVLIRISTSVMWLTPKTFGQAPGTGFWRKHAIGIRNKVAG